ncbi:MAG: hypothetical protein HQK53_19295, partial [Oligoflexia bacterium]|nr:hypothetical protein [Oligoflexia bacterium]
AKILAKVVHTLFTILPFEKSWFNARGVERVRAVPHPLLLKIAAEATAKGWNEKYERCFDQRISFALENASTRRAPAEKRVVKILLLPGSRNHEVQNLLGLFLAAVDILRHTYPEWQIELLLVKSPSVAPIVYEKFPIESNCTCKCYWSEDLLSAMLEADVALAASGTVTLATALLGLPTVVAYKISWFSALVYNTWVRYYGPVSLANIVLGQMVFPELLQEKATPAAIQKVLAGWLVDTNSYVKVVESLRGIKQCLQGEDFSIHDYFVDTIIGSYTS